MRPSIRAGTAYRPTARVTAARSPRVRFDFKIPKHHNTTPCPPARPVPPGAYPPPPCGTVAVPARRDLARLLGILANNISAALPGLED